MSEELYTQAEKVQICTDICIKLKYYKTDHGEVIDLFKDSFEYVPKLKKIINDYIHGNRYYRGSLSFDEIGKNIKYFFQIYKYHNPLFVIKMD